jgi:hypothetical protein
VPLKDLSSSTAGIRGLSDAPEAVVGGELVARVEAGPITSAATSAPTSAATAVIKPAIAVSTPGTELQKLQNPPAVFSSPTIRPPPKMVAGFAPLFNGKLLSNKLGTAGSAPVCVPKTGSVLIR